MNPLKNTILLSIRLLSIFVGTLLFGWYNVFTYLTSDNLAKDSAIAWLMIGLGFCILTYITALNYSKNIISKIVSLLYILFSAAIVLIITLDLLFSLMFSQNALLLADIFLLIIVIGNVLLLSSNHRDLLISHRSTFLKCIVASLLFTSLLTVRWSYLSEKVTCTGTNSTKYSDNEEWTYELTRLQCLNYQIYD